MRVLTLSLDLDFQHYCVLKAVVSVTKRGVLTLPVREFDESEAGLAAEFDSEVERSG